MGGRVVHYTIAADDVGAMATFYSDVFGWRVAPRAMTSVAADMSGTYTYAEAVDGGIAGGFTPSDAVGRRGVVLVVEVDDLEETIQRAEGVGARRGHPGGEHERMEMIDAGGSVDVFDLNGFEDPEGNLVYVVSPVRVGSSASTG
jgi:predicted enzyme related to lactoylglutathione lyase